MGQCPARPLQAACRLLQVTATWVAWAGRRVSPGKLYAVAYDDGRPLHQPFICPTPPPCPLQPRSRLAAVRQRPSPEQRRRRAAGRHPSQQPLERSGGCRALSTSSQLPAAARSRAGARSRRTTRSVPRRAAVAAAARRRSRPLASWRPRTSECGCGVAGFWWSVFAGCGGWRHKAQQPTLCPTNPAALLAVHPHRRDAGDDEAADDEPEEIDLVDSEEEIESGGWRC